MVRSERFELPTPWFVAKCSIQLSYERTKQPLKQPLKQCSAVMAEREGFEPSIGDKPYTPLAGERLRPLGHLSGATVLPSGCYDMVRSERFELPTP